MRTLCPVCGRSPFVIEAAEEITMEIEEEPENEEPPPPGTEDTYPVGSETQESVWDKPQDMKDVEVSCKTMHFLIPSCFSWC